MKNGNDRKARHIPEGVLLLHLMLHLRALAFFYGRRFKGSEMKNRKSF